MKENSDAFDLPLNNLCQLLQKDKKSNVEN